MRSRTLAGLIVGGAILFLAGRWTAGPDSSAPDPAPSDASTSRGSQAVAARPLPALAEQEGSTGEAGPEEAPPARKDSAQEEEPPVTRVGSFLADYYGPRWPEMEARLREKKPELLERLAIELRADQLPPDWREVREDLRDCLFRDLEENILDLLRVHLGAWRLPEEFTAEFLEKEFGIYEDVDPVALHEARIVAEAQTPEVENAFSELAATLWEAAERAWAAGRYEKWPLMKLDDALPPPGETGDDVLVSLSCYQRFWIVGLPIRYSDHPDLAERVKQVRRLSALRTRAVGRALEGER